MSKKLIATMAVAVVFVLGGSLAYAGVDPADLCKEKKAKAAGKKAFDILKAFGKNIKKPDDPKLASAISKAQSKFTKSFNKENDKGGCPWTGDSDRVEAQVDSAVQSVLPYIERSLICTENGDDPQCEYPTDPCTDGTCAISGNVCATYMDCDPGEECCCHGICL